jgi:hypothetical protein
MVEVGIHTRGSTNRLSLRRRHIGRNLLRLVTIDSVGPVKILVLGFLMLGNLSTETDGSLRVLPY